MVNDLGLLTVPDGVVTVTGPFVAPTGTTTTILPAVSLVMDAATPLNVTWVAPLSFRPQI
jgi:hypothetical protein